MKQITIEIVKGDKQLTLKQADDKNLYGLWIDADGNEFLMVCHSDVCAAAMFSELEYHPSKENPTRIMYNCYKEIPCEVRIVRNGIGIEEGWTVVRIVQDEG